MGGLSTFTETHSQAFAGSVVTGRLARWEVSMSTHLLQRKILATWEAEIRRIAVQGHLMKPHLSQELGRVAHACCLSCGGKHKIERSWSRLA
jgi:hypothetical protein